VNKERLMSATTSAVGSMLPANDGWTILAAPPGHRDLAVARYWDDSRARSRRRREARRRPALLARGGARLSVALAAVALGGPAAGTAVAATGAAAQSPAGDLSRGDHGPAVRALQRALGVTADGAFGPQTERAVRSFQRGHDLPVTGRADAATQAALGLEDSDGAAGASTADASSRPITLTRRQVKRMQRKLHVRVDGAIGPRTRAALRRYERAHGLPADGRPDAHVLLDLGIDTRAGTGQPAPAPAAGVQAAVDAAMSKVGSPYSSGATGPGAFDCSGLVTWAMRKAGISVPRTSYDQFGIGSGVSRGRIQAGDLVFFDTNGPGASDVGMATGPGTAVSATTHGVMTHAILSGYWGSHYVGARRVGG
jgi:cell wall-associated NlpC family hydrolase